MVRAHFTKGFSIIIQIRWKIVYHIATKSCTCHDSRAVVPCAKFHSDHFTRAWMREKWDLHRIWIRMEKSFVKWTPGRHMYMTYVVNTVVIYEPCACRDILHYSDVTRALGCLKWQATRLFVQLFDRWQQRYHQSSTLLSIFHKYHCYIKHGDIITNSNLWNPWGYVTDMLKCHGVGVWSMD